MEQFLIALQHLRIDLEHLYEDLERIEANLMGCEEDHGVRLWDLADHVKHVGGHLHAALAKFNLLELRAEWRGARC